MRKALAALLLVLALPCLAGAQAGLRWEQLEVASFGGQASLRSEDPEVASFGGQASLRSEDPEVASFGGQATAVLLGPPRETGDFLKADLVEVVTLDPAIHLDIRYATANNLVGRPVYPQARAFLQRPAAEALVRVNAALKKEGVGLLVFDGYRPWSVTKIFWDVTPPDKREFVADPAKGSKHNRGCAVDLSLYSLADGREVPMPSVYDEMSPRAYPSYAGGTAAEREARDRLRRAMETEGFSVEPNEWWHFNYRDWARYPILDIAFSDVK